MLLPSHNQPPTPNMVLCRHGFGGEAISCVAAVVINHDTRENTPNDDQRAATIGANYASFIHKSTNAAARGSADHPSCIQPKCIITTAVGTHSAKRTHGASAAVVNTIDDF